jgi:SRSO17 transposase
LYPNSNANNIVEWRQQIQFDKAKLNQNKREESSEPITILDIEQYSLENRLSAGLESINNDLTLKTSNSIEDHRTQEKEIVVQNKNEVPIICSNIFV